MPSAGPPLGVGEPGDAGLAHRPPGPQPESPARPPGRDHADAELQTNSDAVALARRLMRQASQNAQALPARVDETVMLDLEAHGVRCLLIATKQSPDRPPPLSPREREIVRMVSIGYPTKTIAAILDISGWTVSTHLRRVFGKLGVRTRAAMVARAIENGLIPPQPPTRDQDAGRAAASPPDR